MRKNKLYNRKDVNLFDGGGFTEEGWYTKNKEGEGVHLSTAGGLALGATAANGILGGLAGENETGVGNALKGIGQTAAVLPGPYGKLIRMGLENTGNLLNAAFGSNLNEAAIQEIKTRAADQAFQEFSHSSNEDLLAQNQTMSMLGDVSRKDVGTQGWFSNKASKKARELSNLNKQANMSMLNNYGNAVDTVAQNNFFNSIDTGNNILACGGHKRALGGNIFGKGGYTPSKEVIDFIKQQEGFRGSVYKDGKGIDTIGYGFTDPEILKKYRGKKMSEKEGHSLFMQELNKRIPYVAKNTPNWNILPDSAKDALVSYYYNFPFSKSNSPAMIKALEIGDWEGAALNMDAGYNDKANPGLRKRRQKEQKMFMRDFRNQAFSDKKAKNLIEKPDITGLKLNPLIQPQYIGPTKIQVPQMDIIAEGEEPMDNTFVLPSLTLDQAYRGMFPNNGLGDYMYMKENNGGNITYPMFMDMIHQQKYGGDLNTQGASFPGEMVYINEGGSHETNPVGGVPVGVDPEGIPNLVEEGETIFNDYVFSNRLEVPKEVKKALGLRGKKKYTFAEASKYLNKEAEERPNDDISERGVENSLANLMMTQEITKQKEENNIMAEGGKIHIAENKKGTFTAAASKHHMGVQEFANKVLANKDNYSPAMVKKANFARNASKWHALGGNLYFDGSGLRKKTYTDNDLGWDLTNWSNWLNPWGKPIWDYTHPGNTTNHYVPLDITKEQVIEAENRDDYKRFMQAMKLDEEGGPNDVAQAYMNFYDSRVPNPGNKFYTGKVLRPDWREYANRIMTDHLAGIGHSMAPQVGKRYYYKDTNGNRVYVDAPEDLSKYTIGEGVVDPNDPRWTDYEITGLANTPAATPEEAAAQQAIQDGQKTTNLSEEPLRDYPEYLRYAPTVMSGLGVLTDAFGITNKPDYSLSRGLNRIAANTRYRPVNYTPVGEYLTYTPVDTLKHSIDTQAAHQAVARNLFNTSAGNRGNLQAGLLLNNNAQVVNAGNALFNANIMNQQNKERVGTFNRATDTQNAQGSLHAQTANQHAFMQAQQQRNALMASALEAAVKERELASQNKSRNLINFANNLGLIGRENWAQNRLNWLIRNGYYRRYGQPATTVSKVPATTVTTTKVPEQITVPLRPEELTPEEKAIRNGWIINWGNLPTYRKCGGKVNRKRKKGLTY